MKTTNCVRAPGKRLQPRAVWFVLSLHRWAPQMRYEQGEMVYSQTESMLPSLGSRQQQREMPWRFSFCIIIPCRRDQRYKKRIMVSCMQDSDKLKMMRQEGKVRHLSEAGLTELWAWWWGRQGQTPHLEKFTTKLEIISRQWLRTGLPVPLGGKGNEVIRQNQGKAKSSSLKAEKLALTLFEGREAIENDKRKKKYNMFCLF